MEIRAMVEMQAAIARQEDVKRKQQRELKARENEKQRTEVALRLGQMQQDQSISGPLNTQEDRNIDMQAEKPHKVETFLSLKEQSDSSQSESTYFTDPNLGGKIDISS